MIRHSLALAFLTMPSLCFAQAGTGPKALPPLPGPDTTAPNRSTATPTKSVDLRPRFERGQALKYAITIDGVTQTGASTPSSNTPSKKPAAPSTPSRTKQPDDLAAPGLTGDDALPPSKIHWELTLDLNVKEHTEAKSTVEATLKVVRARIGDGADAIDFDSTKSKPGGAASTPLDDLAKPQTLTFSIDADGNITNLANSSGGLGGLSPGAVPDANLLTRSIFTTSRAPGRANVGDTWQVQDTIDSGVIGEFKIASTNHLVSHASNRAKITTEGKITPVPKRARSRRSRSRTRRTPARRCGTPVLVLSNRSIKP